MSFLRILVAAWKRRLWPQAVFPALLIAALLVSTTSAATDSDVATAKTASAKAGSDIYISPLATKGPKPKEITPPTKAAIDSAIGRGIKFLLERKIDVFLAERDVVLAQLDDASRSKVTVLKRQFTHQPLSLALPRGDDDFRLAGDTALTAVLSSPEFPALYAKYFGSLDEGARTFFTWATPPQ